MLLFYFIFLINNSKNSSCVCFSFRLNDGERNRVPECSQTRFLIRLLLSGTVIKHMSGALPLTLILFVKKLMGILPYMSFNSNKLFIPLSGSSISQTKLCGVFSFTPLTFKRFSTHCVIVLHEAMLLSLVATRIPFPLPPSSLPRE